MHKIIIDLVTILAVIFVVLSTTLLFLNILFKINEKRDKIIKFLKEKGKTLRGKYKKWEKKIKNKKQK